MQEEAQQLFVSEEAGAIVVQLAEQRILDEISIARIGAQINELIAGNKRPKLVIDFTNVAHMSSSALGMLITLHKHIRERSGQLRLCCIQPSIYEVFVITRLNEIFRIYRSRQEALESIG